MRSADREAVVNAAVSLNELRDEPPYATSDDDLMVAEERLEAAILKAGYRPQGF